MLGEVWILNEKAIDFPPHLKNKFDGYLTEEGKGIFISLVCSRNSGKGNFSKLLRYLKGKYEWIKIPMPSVQMKKICLKKKFVLKTEFFPEPFNEMGEILLWKKNGFE